MSPREAGVAGAVKRHVLHLVWEYPPVIYGGLARHAESLARAQHAHGLAVTVVTAAEDVTDQTRRVAGATRLRRGVRVVRARRAMPRLAWSDLLGAAAQLDDALSAAASGELASGSLTPLAAVHAHDWIGARAARDVARRAEVPLVLTVHATEFGRRQGAIGAQVDGGRPARVHALERAGVAAAQAVIVCSAAMRAEVCDVLDADPGKVHVVPNAVDALGWRPGPAAVRAARQHWIGATEGPLIALAGRIEWEKGFSTMIRALPRLRHLHPSLRVVLAGRGSYTGQLIGLAEELEVADLLVLPGWLARRDLAALYCASDVVVVPSRYEPSGLVAREAQAAGATVICARTGGLVEAVTDGVSGLLIEVGDVDGLAERVSMLAGNPARSRLLAQAGQRAVHEVSWDQVADATSAVYASSAVYAMP